MTETLTVRFQESEEYDINEDAEVVTHLAITSIGTWSSRVFKEGPAENRKVREAFKHYVLGAMQLGLEPKYVDIGEALDHTNYE